MFLKNCYKQFERMIRISPSGWHFIKKHFPGPYHCVFGYIIDGEENDGISYSSFHDEFDEQFNGVDGFTHLAKALDPNALTGTQVMLPPKNLIDKTLLLLEDIQHQHTCCFLFIVPASQLFMIKWRLRDKLNLNVFKFQGSKKTKLTISTREEYFCISFGSNLTVTPKIFNK